MKTYYVSWEIEITADSPLEAAQEALRTQRDPDSMATTFQIIDPYEKMRYEVDLMQEEGKEITDEEEL